MDQGFCVSSLIKGGIKGPTILIMGNDHRLEFYRSVSISVPVHSAWRNNKA